MTDTSRQNELGFLIAMGQEFGQAVCPPVPRDEAAPNECCEAIYLALGKPVTPERLAALGPTDHIKLADAFGRWFECNPPQPDQIAKAVERTLFRWPIRSMED